MEFAEIIPELVKILEIGLNFLTACFWPALILILVVILVVIFRADIKAKIKGTKSLKTAGLEVLFEQIAEDFTATKRPKGTTIKKDVYTHNDYIDLLNKYGNSIIIALYFLHDTKMGQEIPGSDKAYNFVLHEEVPIIINQLTQARPESKTLSRLKNVAKYLKER